MKVMRMPRTRCGPRADLGEVLRGVAARGRYGYQGRLGSSLWRQRRPQQPPSSVAHCPDWLVILPTKPSILRDRGSDRS